MDHGRGQSATINQRESSIQIMEHNREKNGNRIRIYGQILKAMPRSVNVLFTQILELFEVQRQRIRVVKGRRGKNVQNVRQRGKQMGIDIWLFQQYVKMGII
jgi:hypothetical protein